MSTSISSSYQQVQTLSSNLDEVAKFLSNLKNSGNCGSSFLLNLEEFLSSVIPNMMEKTNKILKQLEEMNSLEQNVKLEEEEEIDFSELSLNYGAEFWEGANNLDNSVKEEIDSEEDAFDPLEILPENSNEHQSNQHDFLSIASNLLQNKIPVQVVKRNRKKVIKPKSTPNTTVSRETKKTENETNMSKQLIVSLTRISDKEMKTYKIPEGKVIETILANSKPKPLSRSRKKKGGNRTKRNDEIIEGRPKRKRKTVKIAKKIKFSDDESEDSKNSENDASYVPSEDEDAPKKRKTGKLPLTPEKEAEIIEHDKNVMDMIKNLKFIHKPFTCPICQKMTKKSIQLTIHMHSHLKGLNAQCSICNRQFKHKYLLDTHMGKEHSEEVSKTKSINDESYFAKFQVEDYTNPDVNEAYPFRCPICHKPCKTRYQAISHVESHSTEKKYLCSECGKSFTRQSAFCRHVQWWHTQPEGKIYKCPTCKKEFDTIKKFRAHLQLSHRSLDVDNQVYDEIKVLETLGIDPLVGRKFLRLSTPKVLKLHICLVCNKRFLYKQQLEAHRHYHDPSIKFDCKFPGCGKSFGSKIRLRTHTRYHTQRPKIYNCTQCSATFKWLSGLRRHNDNIHPKEIVNWLYCPKCPDLRFKGQNVLTNHLNNAHYGKSNNFKCDVNECQMHFENEEEVQVHKETSHKDQSRCN